MRRDRCAPGAVHELPAAPLKGRRAVLEQGAALAALGGFCWLGGPRASAAAGAQAADADRMMAALGAPDGLPAPDSRIELVVPEMSDNGATVPVSVLSSLPGTQQISIWVVSNPQPLVATFTLHEQAEPFVSVRVKFAESSKVYAVVKADGKLYCASRDTQVTVGGCG